MEETTIKPEYSKFYTFAMLLLFFAGLYILLSTLYGGLGKCENDMYFLIGDNDKQVNLMGSLFSFALGAYLYFYKIKEIHFVRDGFEVKFFCRRSFFFYSDVKKVLENNIVTVNGKISIAHIKNKNIIVETVNKNWQLQVAGCWLLVFCSAKLKRINAGHPIAA